MTLRSLARDTAREEKPERGHRAAGVFLARHAGAVVVLAAFVFAAMLALPGRSVTTIYLQDLIAQLDAGYRVVQGQIPNRDFHTPLGPLLALIAAAGLWLTDSAGAAIPTGMAIMLMLAAPAFARVLCSRLVPALSIPFGIFALLILAVPINLGENVTALGYAGLHNRIGWAGIAVLLVMILPPRRSRHGLALDAVSAAAITAVLILTKMSFGLVALAFLLFLATDRRNARMAAAALALTVLILAAAELMAGFSAGYVEDLARAARTSGWVRGSIGNIVDHLFANLADIVLFSLAAGLCLYRTGGLRMALYFLFCAVAGFLLINHAFQIWGIMTLHAGAVVAAERLLRAAGPDEALHSRIAAGTPFVALALVLPPAVHFAAALVIHTAAAVGSESTNFGELRLSDVTVANLWTWSDYESAEDYAARAAEGAKALKSLGATGRIVVLDMANPFSVGLGLMPARGDLVGVRAGRTMKLGDVPAPERVLTDALIVMEPKPLPGAPAVGGRGEAADLMRSAYGAYTTAHFVLVRETEHWRIFGRPARNSAESGAR